MRTNPRSPAELLDTVRNRLRTSIISTKKRLFSKWNININRWNVKILRRNANI